MNARTCGREGENSKRRLNSTIMSPKMKEKRTAEIVKSVLTNVKERLLLSGSLLTEEETALNQLEQLYLAKFLRPVKENENETFQSSMSKAFDDKRKDEDLYGSLFTSRRDSDASFSNDTHLSNAYSSTSKNPSTKERDYYSGKDLWKRQWQRKKHWELRRLVEPLPLQVDSTLGVCLVRAISLIYDELLLEGKAPLAAYDLLITTLRSYFARETWPDLVEPYVGQFVRDHMLLSAAQLTEKYSTSGTVVVEQLDEYKLQSLLHFFAISLDTENVDDIKNRKLEKLSDVLRAISTSFGGSNILSRFLDDEILESFLDIIPKTLAHIYEKLNMSLPPELTIYGSDYKEEDNADSKATKSKGKAAKAAQLVTTPKKLGRPRKETQRVMEANLEKDRGEVILAKAKNTKKIKKERCMEDIEEVIEPEMQVAETIIREETQSFECRPKKLKFTETRPLNKIVIESSAASTVLVSVRQSPRHHASTRALYGNTSTTLSELLQPKEEQADGKTRNGCLTTIPTSNATAPASTMELLNESTRLVLVKDKRGYLLKNFLQDEANEEMDDHHHHDVQSKKEMPTKKKKLNSTKVGGKKIEKSTTNKKVVGKLKLEKAKIMGKKSWTTSTNKDEKIIGGKKKIGQGGKIKKKLNGRIQEEQQHQRLIITKIRSKGSTDQSPSFVASLSPVPSTKPMDKIKSNNRQNDQTNSDSRLILKVSKTRSLTNVEKNEATNLKSPKSKSSTNNEKGQNSNYDLPSFAVDNYVKFTSDIRRERKRARNDPEDEAELFYARGTRRHSIFYDGGSNEDARPISKCYSDEQMAPKNRSGRKMKSSLEVFHLANYLLNVQNANPSTPTIPKNLQQALNTPIRLYKKLRLAPKNNRRRSLRQFCALKFNADEFKIENGHHSGLHSTPSSSTIDEERSATEADECASLELNCGEPSTMNLLKEEIGRRDLKTTLTVDTSLVDDPRRRNSVSVCAGLWNGGKLNAPTTTTNGYYLRRRRLFSDGHMSTASSSSIISPDMNGMKRTIGGRRGSEFEDVKIKFKEMKDPRIVLKIHSSDNDGKKKNGIPENELFLIAKARLNGQQILEPRRSVDDEDGQGGAFLNRLSSHAAGGLLQLANSSQLICTGLATKNFTQVATDVR